MYVLRNLLRYKSTMKSIVNGTAPEEITQKLPLIEKSSHHCYTEIRRCQEFQARFLPKNFSRSLLLLIYFYILVLTVNEEIM